MERQQHGASGVDVRTMGQLLVVELVQRRLDARSSERLDARDLAVGLVHPQLCLGRDLRRVDVCWLAI